ncbi:MAG: FISUMP domain-containing protein [Bacteroidota bacterium]
MKKKATIVILAILLLFVRFDLFSQVGINRDNSKPDSSAMLEVKSSNSGVLIPRVALISSDSPQPMNTPVATGLLVYNTNSSGSSPNQVIPGFYYWNGATWISWSTPTGAVSGDMLYWNGASWVILPPGLHAQQLIFCNGSPVWGGCVPLLDPTPIDSITSIGAISGGAILNDGGSAVVSRGVCWSTSPLPTIIDNKTIDGEGIGKFTSIISGLHGDSTYYVRSYAINSKGIAYGNDTSFTTPINSFAPRTIAREIRSCPSSLITIPVITKGFLGIGGFTLTLEYDSAKLHFYEIENTSRFPGFSFKNAIPGKLIVNGFSADSGVALQDSSILFSLVFLYDGDTVPIQWLPGKESCIYYGYPSYNPLIQEPMPSYYFNGIVQEIPQKPVSVSIAASADSVCAGISITYTATATNGGVSPAYQWNVNRINITGATNSTYSYSPEHADIVKCKLTSNVVCPTGNPATSNTVNMTVNPILPVSVSIAVSANPVCVGTQVTFIATPTNGGTTPVFQWKVNGTIVSGATNNHYSYTAVNNDAITCVLISNTICSIGNPSTSNTVTMIVNPILPVSVSAAVSANPVCAGTKASFTATPANGGSAPAYQWQANGANITGATNTIFSYTPTHNDTIKCLMTSNGACTTGNPATSNAINMTVNPLLPVSVSVVPSANPVCSTTLVTYTALPTHGGSMPSFQWNNKGININGATNATYSFTPINNDAVTCILTSNAACPTGNPATSNIVSMNVIPLLPVSISIVASATVVCAGTQATFTATPTNGGSSPGYQWRINGANINGATNTTYSYIPVNNNAITCLLTSNAVCPNVNPAISNIVTMTVNQLRPVSISIAASANPVCVNTSVTFNSTLTNGGLAPAYHWKVNGTNVNGATNATFSFAPANNQVVTCLVTSNAICPIGNPATSNPLTMTVNPMLPVSISISASSNPICSGVLVTDSAMPTNGGSHPVYQWILNNANVTGATNSTYSYNPANNDVIKCLLYSNVNCPTGNPATSNIITQVVNQLTPVSATISASAYSVMPGDSVTYTVTPFNGGATPVYQWKVNNNTVGTNSNTYKFSPSNNDNITCKLTSSLTVCLSNNPATSNVVNMIVYSNGTACAGTPTVVYDGMTYNTVQIGAQCWLRENMNIGVRINSGANQSNNNIIEKYCYNNDPNNCNVYGGLYQWAEMVQYLNGVTNTTHWNPLPTGNVQGICPSGWHIPTNTEASTLITYLGGSNVAGGKIKEVGTTHWGPYNSGASNTSGYTAIPGGSSYNGLFGDINAYCTIWTTTKGTLPNAARYFCAAFNFQNSGSGESYKIIGYAVRCVKD